MSTHTATGYHATPGVSGLKGINREMRLYLIPAGDGFSCYGFDVLHRKTTDYAAWAGRPDLAPPPRKGTLKAWKAYQKASAAALAKHNATRERCPIELTPQLIGLEGKRVEVTAKDGSRRRFYVGKSTGWTPCHLEVHNSRSTGGMAVYLAPGDRVSVVR